MILKHGHGKDASPRGSSAMNKRPRPATDIAGRLKDALHGHQNQHDRVRAIEEFAEAREAEEGASRGNDSPSWLD